MRFAMLLETAVATARSASMMRGPAEAYWGLGFMTDLSLCIEHDVDEAGTAFTGYALGLAG